MRNQPLNGTSKRRGRKPRTQPETTAAPIFCPGAVYSLDQLRAALGVRRSSLGREIRLGRLQVSKRCGRYWFRSEWILSWLDGGLQGEKSECT